MEKGPSDRPTAFVASFALTRRSLAADPATLAAEPGDLWISIQGDFPPAKKGKNNGVVDGFSINLLGRRRRRRRRWAAEFWGGRGRGEFR